VAVFHEQLHHLVGDQSIALVNETLDDVPETATRSDVLAVLQYELGSSEEAAIQLLTRSVESCGPPSRTLWR
jgi:hypothetical protein